MIGQYRRATASWSCWQFSEVHWLRKRMDAKVGNPGAYPCSGELSASFLAAMSFVHQFHGAFTVLAGSDSVISA
jgi:hypothetical protein